ncbi:MAG: GatB/YqeY domain-containing protein [Alkalilacustris sp.]
MDLRTRIASALKAACAGGEDHRAATLRLLHAAIRDRDLALAAEGRDTGLDEAALREILRRLAAHRRTSAAAFEETGRLEQAAEKTAEAEVIEEFLPRPMPEGEIEAEIRDTVHRLGARSLRDIGRVMEALRPRLGDHLPVADLKGRVRRALAGP